MEIGSKSEVSRGIAKRDSMVNAEEFMIYEDKAIHGWLHKKGKGYF